MSAGLLSGGACIAESGNGKVRLGRLLGLSKARPRKASGCACCCVAAPHPTTAARPRVPGGFTVPRGQDVMISVYNIHRSPAGEAVVP